MDEIRETVEETVPETVSAFATAELLFRSSAGSLSIEGAVALLCVCISTDGPERKKTGHQA